MEYDWKKITNGDWTGDTERIIYYTKYGRYETTINGTYTGSSFRKNLHRIDGGPALIGPFNIMHWYKYGMEHNDQGPTTVWCDGICDWCIYGKNKTKEIENWIKEKGLPYWLEWDDKIKILFKLTWC